MVAHVDKLAWEANLRTGRLQTQHKSQSTDSTTAKRAFSRIGVGLFFKPEIIAEIGFFFIEDPLRLSFPALVIRSLVIEITVDTGVEVRPARGTGVPSANLFLCRQFLSTRSTSGHIGIILPHEWKSIIENIGKRREN